MPQRKTLSKPCVWRLGTNSDAPKAHWIGERLYLLTAEGYTMMSLTKTQTRHLFVRLTSVYRD